MPDQDSPQDRIQRLESHLDEVSRGLDNLDKEVRAVLKQWGKKSSAPSEPEAPRCDDHADVAIPGAAS